MAALSLLWDTKMANNLLLFLPFSLALPSGPQGGPVWGGGGEGGDEGMNFKQIQKLPLEQSPFVKIHWKGFFKPSKTNISPVICVPPPGETRIPSDMCSPTSETHIPSDLCSSFQETRIPSDTCSPTWETHIPSDMCPPTRETRIPSDMCSPTWGNTYP